MGRRASRDALDTEEPRVLGDSQERRANWEKWVWMALMEKRETKACLVPPERRGSLAGGVVKEPKVNEESEVTVGSVETPESREQIILSGEPEAKRVKSDKWESLDLRGREAKMEELGGRAWLDAGGQ